MSIFCFRVVARAQDIRERPRIEEAASKGVEACGDYGVGLGRLGLGAVGAKAELPIELTKFLAWIIPAI